MRCASVGSMRCVTVCSMPWVTLLGVIAAAALPAHAVSLPWPVSTSYASLDPEVSANWMVKYLGAEIIPSNWSVGCGSVAWVRMPGSGYEFHFVSSPQLANVSYSFEDYVAYVNKLYGNLSEQSSSSYDQFMDFHIGMIVDDMTPFYTALKTDDVPFFMVGQYPAFFDLFVEIPKTGAILELTSQRLDVANATISPWDICQQQMSSDLLKPASIKEVPGGSAFMKAEKPVAVPLTRSGFPAVNWRKTTFAAPYPILMEVFTIKYLNFSHIRQGHPGVWLRECAKIAWTQSNYEGPAGIPYQFHMVDGYSYPPYEGLDVPGYARLQQSQRDFAHDRLDEWAFNYLALWVQDLTPYYTRLKADNVSFVLRTDTQLFSLLVDTSPVAGNVIALVSDVLHVDFQATAWASDFCGV